MPRRSWLDSFYWRTFEGSPPETVMQLRITEIFHSLQGEARSVGLPTVFVRLTGCPLRCQYCDTAYAFSGGELMTVNAILSKIETFACRRICVTGGEPLAQPGCLSLLDQLCHLGFDVSLETSGALSIAEVNQAVSRVVDIKSKMAKLIQQQETPGLRKGLATSDTNTTTRERLNFAEDGIHRHQFTT